MAEELQPQRSHSIRLATAHGFRGIFDQKLSIAVQPTRLRVGNDVEEEGSAGSNSVQTALQSRSGVGFLPAFTLRRPDRDEDACLRRRLLGFVSAPFLAGFGFIGSIIFPERWDDLGPGQ